MGLWRTFAVFLFAAGFAWGAEPGAAGLIILQNTALRIELDPALFAVRFVGFPGGNNFVEPHYIEDRDRDGGAWLDPGGLTTDLVPLDVEDAALRRGPAEIIEQDEHHVVLLGKASPALGVRFKKEIRLDGDAARAWFIVTALSDRAEGPGLCVRNSARLPGRSTVRVPKKEGTFGMLQDETKTPWVIVKSLEYWLVPVPPTSPVKQLALGGFNPEIQVENASGVWVRRLTQPPVDETKLWNGVTALCVLDDTTRSYGAALQGAQGPLTAATPLQLTEEWTFQKRGK